MLKDEEDVAIIQEAVEKQPLVNTPGHYHTTVKMALAPIHFAVRAHSSYSDYLTIRKLAALFIRLSPAKRLVDAIGLM